MTVFMCFGAGGTHRATPSAQAGRTAQPPRRRQDAPRHPLLLMRAAAATATAIATATAAIPLLPYQIDDNADDNRHNDGTDEQIAPVRIQPFHCKCLLFNSLWSVLSLPCMA